MKKIYIFASLLLCFFFGYAQAMDDLSGTSTEEALTSDNNADSGYLQDGTIRLLLWSLRDDFALGIKFVVTCAHRLHLTGKTKNGFTLAHMACFLPENMALALLNFISNFSDEIDWLGEDWLQVDNSGRTLVDLAKLVDNDGVLEWTNNFLQ